MIFIAIISGGCSGLLDEKPNTDLVIPDNLEDLRGLLDNDSQIIGKTGGLHVFSSDDLYLRESGFQNVQELLLGAYQFDFEERNIRSEVTARLDARRKGRVLRSAAEQCEQYVLGLVLQASCRHPCKARCGTCHRQKRFLRSTT